MPALRIRQAADVPPVGRPGRGPETAEPDRRAEKERRRETEEQPRRRQDGSKRIPCPTCSRAVRPCSSTWPSGAVQRPLVLRTMDMQSCKGRVTCGPDGRVFVPHDKEVTTCLDFEIDTLRTCKKVVECGSAHWLFSHRGERGAREQIGGVAPGRRVRDTSGKTPRETKRKKEASARLQMYRRGLD